MASPLEIRDVVTKGTPEPDRTSLYKDKDGDYWWYGRDVDGDEGWVWDREPQAPGTQSVECAYARTWGEDTISEVPWTLIPRPGAADFTIVHEDGHTRPGFVVKDSGVREEYANGFVRDTEDGKYDYARILRIEGLHLIPIEALERWGAHMVKGAEKYGEDNWKQARGPIAIGRFLRSLCRHVVQYIRKDRTEDHAAAVCFNVWAAELTPEEE